MTVRDEIDGAMERGETGLALAGLRQLFQDTPTMGSAQFVLDRLGKLDARAGTARTACRIAILRSFTIEPLVPLLRADTGLYGLDVIVQVGDFNTYMQDILNPGSPLYDFQPHIVILAVQTRDLVPALWERFADLSAEQAAQNVRQAVGDLNHAITTFRAHSDAHLLVHNLEMPLAPSGAFSTPNCQRAVSRHLSGRSMTRWRRRPTRKRAFTFSITTGLRRGTDACAGTMSASGLRPECPSPRTA